MWVRGGLDGARCVHNRKPPALPVQYPILSQLWSPELSAKRGRRQDKLWCTDQKPTEIVAKLITGFI